MSENILEWVTRTVADLDERAADLLEDGMNPEAVCSCFLMSGVRVAVESRVMSPAQIAEIFFAIMKEHGGVEEVAPQ